MNIFQETFLTTSVPVDVQIMLGVSCLIVAVILVNLAIKAVVHPSARNTMTMSLPADYWIRRQKRKSFGYRHTAGRAMRLADSPIQTPMRAYPDGDHSAAPDDDGVANRESVRCDSSSSINRSQVPASYLVIAGGH